MAYTEQEKERALALYDELGSIGKVINQLGYPPCLFRTEYLYIGILIWNHSQEDIVNKLF